MDEWVVIGISTLAPWRGKVLDITKCASQIAPRKGEERKSAWAHCSDRLPVHPHAIITAAGAITRRMDVAQSLAQWVLRRAPGIVSRKLQALCMMLLRASKDEKWPADIVSCVSVNRSALGPQAIIDVPDSHIIAAFDSTHRELTYASIEERKAAVTILEAGRHRAFRGFDYTIAELRPLMIKLHKARLLKPQYAATAERLLAETSR